MDFFLSQSVAEPPDYLQGKHQSMTIIFLVSLLTLFPQSIRSSDILSVIHQVWMPIMAYGRQYLLSYVLYKLEMKNLVYICKV